MRTLQFVTLTSIALATSSVHAVTMWGIDQHNVLFRFDSATPRNIQTAHTLRLPSQQQAVAIDFRPADRQLYVMTDEGEIFSVNTVTPNPASYWEINGEGGRISSLDGTSFGFDFNPVTDRLRITSDTVINLDHTINGSTLVQTRLSTPGRVPAIVGSAYSNNFDGASQSTLYNIDASGTSTNQDWLTFQTPPESGVQNIVGPLGEPVGAEEVGFDIGPSNIGYLACNGPTSNLSQLFTVNLNTGDATYAGDIGASMWVRDIAVAIPEPMAGIWLAAVGSAVRRSWWLR